MINKLGGVTVEVDKGWLYAICKRMPDGRTVSFYFGSERHVLG